MASGSPIQPAVWLFDTSPPFSEPFLNFLAQKAVSRSQCSAFASALEQAISQGALVPFSGK